MTLKETVTSLHVSSVYTAVITFNVGNLTCIFTNSGINRTGGNEGTSFAETACHAEITADTLVGEDAMGG